MPFVNIKIASPILAPQELQTLQQGTTHLLTTILRKKAELTAVLVEQVSAQSWTIGSKPITVAAHLDVKVTEGTNTAEEKERFIAEAMNLLRSAVGSDLHQVAYVVIHELPAESWGWDGLTQAHRALMGKV